MDRSQVFISYSHVNEDWFNRLQVHLKGLSNQGLVEVWSDRKIKAGQDWKDQICQALDRACVAVLLVSPDFLASDFIASHELPYLLDAARHKGLTILWVPVEPSLYRQTDIQRYQAALDPKCPLSNLKSKTKWQAALVEVCEHILQAMKGSSAPLEGRSSADDPGRSSSPQPPEAFRRRVREEVGKRLIPQSLRPLREELGDLDRLIPLTGEFSIKEAVGLLHKSSRTCLEKLVDEGKETEPVVKACKSVLGWLVLLAVSGDWMTRKGARVCDLLEARSVEVPVATECGVEILNARLREQSAFLELDADRERVYGQHQINLLESGIGEDALQDVKAQVWKAVRKDEPPRRFSRQEDWELNSTLEAEADLERIYRYVLLDAKTAAPLVGIRELYQLKDSLPHLSILMMIGLVDGEQVLVLDEERLQAHIRVFMRMLEKYQ